jgi:hypothetical protein
MSRAASLRTCAPETRHGSRHRGRAFRAAVAVMLAAPLIGVPAVPVTASPVVSFTLDGSPLPPSGTELFYQVGKPFSFTVTVAGEEGAFNWEVSKQSTTSQGTWLHVSALTGSATARFSGTAPLSTASATVRLAVGSDNGTYNANDEVPAVSFVVDIVADEQRTVGQPVDAVASTASGVEIAVEPRAFTLFWSDGRRLVDKTTRLLLPNAIARDGLGFDVGTLGGYYHIDANGDFFYHGIPGLGPDTPVTSLAVSTGFRVFGTDNAGVRYCTDAGEACTELVGKDDKPICGDDYIEDIMLREIANQAKELSPDFYTLCVSTNASGSGTIELEHYVPPDEGTFYYLTGVDDIYALQLTSGDVFWAGRGGIEEYPLAPNGEIVPNATEETISRDPTQAMAVAPSGDPVYVVGTDGKMRVFDPKSEPIVFNSLNLPAPGRIEGVYATPNGFVDYSSYGPSGHPTYDVGRVTMPASLGTAPVRGALASGHLVRNCSGDHSSFGPDCGYYYAFLTFDTNVASFNINLPPGYDTSSAGVMVNGEDSVGCGASTSNILMCLVVPVGNELPAGTSLRLAFSSEQVESPYKPLPDNAGATLYLVSPKRAGPYPLPGP